MEISSLKNYLRENVITSSEAAEILQVTKQAVNLYVRDGKIECLRNTPNGTLFFKPDVEAYKNRTQKLTGTQKIVNYSGTTSKSLQFYRENIDKLSAICAIFIYGQDFDAILDDFYEIEDDFEFGNLRRVVNPTFVIRDINGDELWLGGVNCGYNGEGPRGSKTILKEIGISEEIIEKISYHNVIKLFKDGDRWEVFYHGSRINYVKTFFEPSAHIYFCRDRLVLVESFIRRWDADPLLLLEKYRAFIPDPREINIFESDKQAIDYGYSMPEIGTFRNAAFKMIITDQSGRQLWLNQHIDRSVSIEKQDKVQEVIKYLGFDLKELRLTDKIKAWIENDILKIPPQPLSLVK
ncbi:hypothetical protein [Ruminiclostridium cellobioparum]|uniref:hypothetical protein n=1 Tax=Ruminiclostridium cellobioparum TaxID=29355 RepID=UPI0028AE695F|nr:hypothetical protein [Ruminiclostridium cellobioparum]